MQGKREAVHDIACVAFHGAKVGKAINWLVNLTSRELMDLPRDNDWAIFFSISKYVSLLNVRPPEQQIRSNLDAQLWTDVRPQCRKKRSVDMKQLVKITRAAS